MKTTDASGAWPDDDIRFDRLVDGELSPDEYQALLSALDDEPGGWRRCALAFLEAQALGGELTAIRRGDRWTEVPQPATRKASPPLRWTLLPAMAASFLVAFILGVMLPSLWPIGQRSDNPAPDLAANAGGEAAPANPNPFPRTVGNARLMVSGPGGTQSEAGELPIYELSGDASKWLTQGEPGLPAELISELERRGHRVYREQQYVPVSLEDGRHGIIPVESYQITPVSRRAY